MRKRIIAVAILLLLLPFLGGWTVAEELQKEIEEQLGELDTSLFDGFLEQLDENTRKLFQNKSFAEMITELTNGESLDVNGFFSALLSYIAKETLAFIPSLISIIMIALLAGVMNGIRSRFLGKNTAEIVHFVCYLSIVLIVISLLLPLMKMTEGTVQLMRRLMNVMFPVILTLMTASGGAMSGKLFQPLSAILSEGICEILAVVILPLFVAVTVLSVVSNLSDTLSLKKLIDFFKSAALWLNGICFTVFFAFLSVQGITAATYDGVTVRAAKYAIGNSVPIVGGYVREGFDLILASCALIKNSVGVFGLILILCIVILPILQIGVFSLALKLTAGICEPLSDKKVPSFLSAVAGNLSLLVAVIVGVALMFFIAVMLFIATSNAALG